MSNTSTDGVQRTTLTGKPIPHHDQDNLSSVMLSDGGAGFNAGNVGANLLPPGYTDKSLVRIPIKTSDYQSAEPEDLKQTPKKKGGFFSKLFSSNSDQNSEIKVIMMSRGDYLKYWAKGEDGKFLPSVQEPAEGRKEWVRKQLELNEEWKKNDPTLGKADPSIEKPNLLSAAVS